MKYLVIGGTGTLGRAVINELKYPSEITVFSRGELEQQKLKKLYPTMRFVIGDVTNRQALRMAMMGCETVFHFAALKHIDVCEENPMEAIRTNVDGTRNVAETALEAGVNNLVFSSTDKAVLPINVYGMTKAISEKYLLNLDEVSPLNISVFRWGNVIGSRGSAIHTFVKHMEKMTPIPITHTDMTRFWIRIEDAAKFILSTLNGPKRPAQVFIPEMKAASVMEVLEAISRILKMTYTCNVVGVRKGEKLHECLFSSHEKCLNSNTAKQYGMAELMELLKPVVREIASEG